VGCDSPSHGIRRAVDALRPDLLVMGSLSRGGVAGLLMGNTAEKVLGRVDCSLLTIKPDDFVCPITLD
jgi:nucleotide-binding universal stress UspA family protein